MNRPGTIIELRRILSEQFPKAHAHPGGMGGRADGTGWPTGIAALDAAMGGGLPKGEFTEWVAPEAGSGSVQGLHHLIERTAMNGSWTALVDGADGFDATAMAPQVLARLLWVRCRDVGEALKAADVLLRDPNFPLVVIDLKGNPATQLRRIPSSTWHRLSRLSEHNGGSVLFITPYPLVSGTACRIEWRSRLGVDSMDEPGPSVCSRLSWNVTRSTEQTQRHHRAG